MSFTVSHRESRIVMLAQLLQVEKDDTRRWLCAEMNRLVDPVLDSLFDRLETKLTKLMERNELGGDAGDWVQAVNQKFSDLSGNLQQSATLIPQPSTSHLSSLNSNSFIPNLKHVQSQITMTNELTNVQSHPIKHEIELENATVQPTSTSFQINQNAHYSQPIYKDEVEDEEDCDCDECVYGGIEVKKEDDDDDDENNDDHDLLHGNEESVPPVKRSRLDSTQPNNNAEVDRQFSRQPIEQVQQPNPVNSKPFITVYLQCPELECPNTFPEDQLNQHMLDVHSLGPNRCLLKDCGQSFDNSAILSGHIKQAHQGITRWHCDKCPKHFSKYPVLFDHNIKYHQIGHFECTFPSCTFTGQHKMKMINHYTQQHKPELVCTHPGCAYRTYVAAVLKAHERAHLGIRPYRCKWPLCDYSSSYQHTALFHIRTHLARSEKSLNVAQSVDPKDFLEVASDLLL